MGERLSIDMQAKFNPYSALDMAYLEARKQFDDTPVIFKPIDNRYMLFLNTCQHWGAYTETELDTLESVLKEFNETNHTQTGFEHMFRMTKALISLGMHIDKYNEYEYCYLFDVFENMHNNNNILHNPDELNILDDFITLITDEYVNKDKFPNHTSPIVDEYFTFSPDGMNANDDPIISKSIIDMNNKQAKIATIRPYDGDLQKDEYDTISMNPEGYQTYEDLMQLHYELTDCYGLIEYDNKLYSQI